MHKKRILFFDVDGVLIDGFHAKPELRKWWDADIEKDFGINRGHFKDVFFPGVFAQEVVTGKKGLEIALADYFASIGSEVRAHDVMQYWLEKDSNINHAVFEKIKILKETGQVRLMIATNQEHNRARHLMKDLAFDRYFEDMFYSARLGVAKPSRHFFERVTAVIGESAAPPVLFDDTQAVVDAANDFGWEAHQFDSVDDLYKSDFVRGILSAAAQ